MAASKPARIWIGTLSYEFALFDDLSDRLNKFTNYSRGQLEIGDGGFKHWQFVFYLAKPQRLSWIRNNISEFGHYEPTRSEAADEYVWKEESRVADTQFEFGSKPIRRNNVKDWDLIRNQAIAGQLLDIPADVYIRCYSQLKRIACDNLRPLPVSRTVYVFWGRTGSGKSRRAWEEASMEAYPKDPRTKFWDGYQGQKNVVIDEFRGGIDISHLLRWLDRYPVIVEIKGSSTVLKAETIWITSNLDPIYWYPEIDSETRDALLRRMNITYFP